MYTEQDAVIMEKLIGLWSTRKWGNIELLIDMNLRTYRKEWYSHKFMGDMRLLRDIARSYR